MLIKQERIIGPRQAEEDSTQETQCPEFAILEEAKSMNNISNSI